MQSSRRMTRTISFGCRTAAASGPPGAPRRHSSVGTRALLWAARGARSLGSPLGSDFQTSRENLHANVLTPDSIPPFTIPSLNVQADGRGGAAGKDAEEEEEEGPSAYDSPGAESGSPRSASSSSSSPTIWCRQVASDLGVPAPDRRAQRTLSDPLRRGSLARECPFPEEALHCLDPASRAALSLPHLAKVTTSYGFVTLGQSPQMASEEALLRPAGLLRSQARRDRGTPSPPLPLPPPPPGHTGTPMARTSGAGIERPSKGSAHCRTGATPTSSHEQASSRKPKRRFYELIRKHFVL